MGAPAPVRRLCYACLRNRMRRVFGRDLRFEDLSCCLFNMDTRYHQQLTAPGKQRIVYEHAADEA